MKGGRISFWPHPLFVLVSWALRPVPHLSLRTFTSRSPFFFCENWGFLNLNRPFCWSLSPPYALKGFHKHCGCLCPFIVTLVRKLLTELETLAFRMMKGSFKSLLWLGLLLSTVPPRLWPKFAIWFEGGGSRYKLLLTIEERKKKGGIMTLDRKSVV